MMELFFDTFSSPFWQSLVRALIHSLWIGPLIIGLTLTGLWATPAGNSATRYGGTLFAQISLLIITCLLWGVFHYGQTQKSSPTPSISKAETHHIYRPESTSTGISTTLPTAPGNRSSATQWNLFLAPIWMSGVGFFLGILICDTSRARQLWQSGNDLSQKESNLLSPLLTELSRRLKISGDVSIKVTEYFHHPAVSGIIKPVIILPAKFVEKATPKMLKAVLAHELAHIRRHDFLINLVQRVLESFLFFNPAMWLLGSLVRSEREAACDAMAIDVIGEKLAYVEGVTDWIAEYSEFESLRLSPAIDGNSRSGMVDRIKRILFPGRRPLVPIRLRTIFLSLLVVGVSIYALQRGSMAIAQVFSDEERVAVSKELRSEHNDASSRTSPYTLKVTIKHQDGSIPSKEELSGVHLGVNVRKWNGNTGSYGISALGKAEYAREIESGVCKVKMSSPNWAPFSTAFLVPKEDRDLLEVEITLDPGEPAWFALQDPQGKPVSDVRLSAIMGTNGTYLTYQSDSEGLVKLAVTQKGQYNVSVKDSRFAWMDLKGVSVAPGQTVPIQLKEGSPVTLKFISKTSRQPIQGEIRSASAFDYHGAKHLARTNEFGQLTLTVLGNSDIHDFCFLSEQGHRIFLPGISPHHGREKLIELPEPVTISGWIDLSGPNPPVPDETGIYTIKVSGTASWKEGSSHGWNRKVSSAIESNKRAHFSINEIWPGDLRLSCGTAGAKVTVSDQSIDKLVVKKDPDESKSGVTEPDKRDFLVRFQSPKKTAPFTGELKYRYSKRSPTPPYYNQYEWMDGKSIDGVMNIPRVPISCPFTFELTPIGLNGFWFSKVRHTIPKQADIPTEGSPVEIDVQLLPAGGIQGQVFEANGSPASGVMIGVRHIHRAPQPLYQLPSVKNSSSQDDQISKYFAGPLPLGAVYRMGAHRNNSYVFSPPITLTEKAPFQTVDLRFTEGTPVTGRVILPDGSPVFGVQVKLDFEIKGIGGFSNEGTMTNLEGEFQFNHVDLDNGGIYSLEIGGKTYQIVEKKTIVSKAKHKGLVLAVKKKK